MIKKILNYALLHKITSGGLAVILVFGGYYSYKAIKGNNPEIRYALAAVERGTITTSTSGSGQVSALNQIDVKPKVSGTITYVGIRTGQQVYLGQVLAYLDSENAQRSVRDAQISLESAQISLDKMIRNQEAGSKTTIDNLNQAYKDGYNKVSSAFLDLPNLIELARGVLYDNSVVVSGCGNVCEYGNLADQDFRMEFKSITYRAENDYKVSKDAYDPNFTIYRDVRLDASPEEIISIIQTTEKTAELLAQAIKSEQNMLDALVNNINDEATKQGHKGQIPQQVTTFQKNIGDAVGNINSILSSLGNARRSIESAQRSLEDSALSNPIDIRSQENTVAQRKASLQDAQENLADYAVRAPFTGVVAKTDIKKGDTASGSTIIATLLTRQSVAEVSLNEVDMAQIKMGQKATLIFDAVDGLTITGQIIEVDSLGTVSQGVVTYDIKIGFDVQDDRVKPGMSVSAAIITNVKQNVLLVPNSAIKSTGGISYVEVPSNVSVARELMTNATISTGIILNPVPNRQDVELGLANDLDTEIVSGVNEGDLVVTRIITSLTTSAPVKTQTNSLFPTSGGRTNGGATRIQAR